MDVVGDNIRPMVSRYLGSYIVLSYSSSTLCRFRTGVAHPARSEAAVVVQAEVEGREGTVLASCIRRLSHVSLLARSLLG